MRPAPADSGNTLNTLLHRDLRDTERRESQLWILAFALLGLFGAVIIGHFAVTLLGNPDTPTGLTRTTATTALTGLFFLIALKRLSRTNDPVATQE